MSRLAEPSTYAGIGLVLSGLQSAVNAAHVASAGSGGGIAAIIAGIAAFCKAETPASKE
jgi:hypothetical protein